MKLLVCYGAKINVDTGGNPYIKDGEMKHYSLAFDNITYCFNTILASQTELSKLVPLDEKIVFIPFKTRRGRISKITTFRQNFNIIKTQVNKSDLVLVKMPSIESVIAVMCAKKMNKPYIIEAVGCPWDAYWNHSFLGKIVAPAMWFLTKRIIKNAPWVTYVSEKFLQKRYPTKGKSIGVSNVKITEIGDEVVAQRLEKIKKIDKKNIILMTSAAIDVKYKGQEYVIRAIKELKRAGIDVTYKVAGGGCQKRLLNIAKKCDVKDNVVFLGSLSRDEVFNHLDTTHIYVQPSLQEGLPRALIEAMSRGCVCIGARTGGIPELLQERFVLSRKSVKDIANAIKNICENEDWEMIAKENFEMAREYEEKKLDAKRTDFYNMIKEEVEK